MKVRTSYFISQVAVKGRTLQSKLFLEIRKKMWFTHDICILRGEDSRDDNDKRNENVRTNYLIFGIVLYFRCSNKTIPITIENLKY